MPITFRNRKVLSSGAEAGGGFLLDTRPGQDPTSIFPLLAQFGLELFVLLTRCSIL